MPSFIYKQVTFKIDVIGSDIWRWTIHRRRDDELTLIGQFTGTKEEATAYCRAQIDRLLARDSPAS